MVVLRVRLLQGFADGIAVQSGLQVERTASSLQRAGRNPGWDIKDRRE